jgi:ribosomal protein S18 acetylase RimI-like enzyme
MTVAVREFSAAEWPMYRELRLGALRESPDAFGSTFAYESVRAEDDWASRLAQGVQSPRDFPVVAEVDGAAAGLAWGRIDERRPGVAHVYQVWVVPEYRGLGVGRALLEAVVAWAQSSGVHTVTLSVTCGDSPALRLYHRAGFVALGDPQPLRPGSDLRSQGMQLILTSAR